MRASSAWLVEFRVALLHALWLPVLWWVTGEFSWGLVAALASYLVSHLRHTFALSRWLEHARAGYPPDGAGVWAGILRNQSEHQKEHRQRKQRLARLVVRLQRSALAIPDALVVLNGALEIEWTNKAAETLLGVSTPGDSGQPIEFFVRHPDFSAFIHAPDVAGCMLRSPAQPTRFLELRLFWVADDNALLIAQDATARVKVDQMRKDFVADVSHELRTPLTVLSGYLENMGRDPSALPDTWRRPVLSMTEQTARMRRIVEDLLLIARMEGGPPGEVEVVNVAGLTAALAHDGRELTGPRAHDVTCEVDSDLGLVGVADELRTAFWNLVANAIQYTPDGGDIHIRWYADARGACFEVADGGEGIAAEHIPRLTERFYRVDRGRSRDSGGTGLGLCIVKHVLERHGAHLEIQSTPGKGSVFRCVFQPEHSVVGQPHESGTDVVQRASPHIA